MSKVRLYGDTSGFVDLKAPDVAGDVTITLPNTSGPFATETYVDAAVAAIPDIAGIGSNVVQTIKSDTYSTSATTYQNVTGMSVTITPTSASSKILLIADLAFGTAGGQHFIEGRFTGGNSTNYKGASTFAFQYFGATTINGWYAYTVQRFPMVYLDSPATASPVVYQFQAKGSGGFMYLNRSAFGSTTSNVSSITTIEVAA